MHMPPQGPARAQGPDVPLKYSNLLLALLISLACLRIISTYFVFSNTVDEPAHIACGLEWLDRHAWTLESPPTPRPRPRRPRSLAYGSAVSSRTRHVE